MVAELSANIKVASYVFNLVFRHVKIIGEVYLQLNCTLKMEYGSFCELRLQVRICEKSWSNVVMVNLASVLNLHRVVIVISSSP